MVKFCFSKEYQELSKNQKSEFETIFKGNLKQKIDYVVYNDGELKKILMDFKKKVYNRFVELEKESADM